MTVSALQTPTRLSEAVLEAIQAVSGRNWFVFPVYGIDGKGFCECGNRPCPDAGKHPRIVNNFEESTDDVEQIKRWDAKWPRCNWGLDCAKSGIAAIDVDPHRGGVETFQRLERTHGRLPHTPRSISGGGGLHALLQHPGKAWKVTSAADVLGPGIDVKGDGGFIVLAGSLHKSGKRYAWDRSALPSTTPLAPLPIWVRDRIAKPIGNVTEEQKRTEENRGGLSVLSVPSVLSVSPPAQPGVSPSLCSSVPLYHPSATPQRLIAGANTQERLQQCGVAVPARGIQAAEPGLQQRIEQAIRDTLPAGHGNRHRCLFNFCRALKVIGELANADPATLKKLVREWHAAALPRIGTKPFDDTWADFLSSWPRVKYPKGSGALMEALALADASPDPPEAQSYDSPDTRRLIRLCRVLQDRAGTEPFFLSCATAAAALGIDRMAAWRRFGMLTQDGILQVAETHTQTKATRYRYVGGNAGRSPAGDNGRQGAT